MKMIDQSPVLQVILANLGQVVRELLATGEQLLVTAETGLIGGLAYHCWLAVIVRRIWGQWKAADPFLGALSLGIVTGLGAWFLKSMFNIHTPFYSPMLWLYAGLAIATMAAIGADSQTVGRAEAELGRRPAA